MSKWFCIQFFIGLVLFAFLAKAEDFSLKNVSYGDLQLIYERPLNQGRTDLSLQYVGGFGNPQYDLQGGIVRGEYWLNNEFSVGMSIGWLLSSPSSLQNILDQTLNQIPVSIHYISPVNIYYANVGFAPLHNLMPFLGNRFISSDLIFSIGPGLTCYSGLLPGNAVLHRRKNTCLQKNRFEFVAFPVSRKSRSRIHLD